MEKMTQKAFFNLNFSDWALFEKADIPVSKVRYSKGKKEVN